MTGHLHWRGFIFAVAVMITGAVGNWFLQAQAPVEAQAFSTRPLAQTPLVVSPAFDPHALRLPEGFTAEWQQVSLDAGRMPLHVLRHKFQPGQTRGGSEYYTYAAALFQQMAAHAGDVDLSRELNTLSTQAQQMGYQVEAAMQTRFEGAIADDMAHLHAQARLMNQLSGLNPRALVRVDVDQNGHILRTETAPAESKAGETLAAFQTTRDRILNHPASRRFPEAMALLREESDLLETLSNHLTLRWESAYYCGHGSDCQERPLSVRVYARQTLTRLN